MTIKISKPCIRCKHYDKVPRQDYGECNIHPSWSYVGHHSTCEDFQSIKRSIKKQ